MRQHAVFDLSPEDTETADELYPIIQERKWRFCQDEEEKGS